MGINGVSSYANTYTYGNVKNENVKPSKNSEKNYYAGYTMNSANKFKNVSDYSKYLTNKYKCLTPCKKSQGMKQLMAGGGVALIGTTLVPLLSGLF